MSEKKHYEISFSVIGGIQLEFILQLEFINVAHDNTREGTQILYTHTNNKASSLAFHE